MAELTHRVLSGSLAAQLRGRTNPPVVFEEIVLTGPDDPEGRMDVVSARVYGPKMGVEVTGFEVKASRSDLLRDIESQKYQKYVPCLHRFFFAVLNGICRTDEIPDVAGVVVFVPEKQVWRQIRMPERLEGPTDLVGVLARLLRRHDAMLQAERSRETRLSRMERLAAMERVEQLAYVLDARIKGTQADARTVQIAVLIRAVADAVGDPAVDLSVLVEAFTTHSLNMG